MMTLVQAGEIREKLPKQMILDHLFALLTIVHDLFMPKDSNYLSVSESQLPKNSDGHRTVLVPSSVDDDDETNRPEAVLGRVGMFLAEMCEP